MTNVRLGASKTCHLKGSGQGCWRGGTFFWNKIKFSIGCGKTKCVYAKAKGSWNFC